MDVFKLTNREVSVNLSGFELGMNKHFLDVVDIRAVLKYKRGQVWRKRLQAPYKQSMTLKRGAEQLPLKDRLRIQGRPCSRTTVWREGSRSIARNPLNNLSGALNSTQPYCTPRSGVAPSFIPAQRLDSKVVHVAVPPASRDGAKDTDRMTIRPG